MERSEISGIEFGCDDNAVVKGNNSTTLGTRMDVAFENQNSCASVDLDAAHQLGKNAYGVKANGNAAVQRQHGLSTDLFNTVTPTGKANQTLI